MIAKYIDDQLEFLLVPRSALDCLAVIILAPDSARLVLNPHSAVTVAVTPGLSRNSPDDHEIPRHGLVLYETQYAWRRTHLPYITALNV